MTRWLVDNKLDGMWKKAVGVQSALIKQELNLVIIWPYACSVSTSGVNNSDNDKGYGFFITEPGETQPNQ
jgi:hypothetical protein